MRLESVLKARHNEVDNLSEAVEMRKANYTKRTGSPGNYKYFYGKKIGKKTSKKVSKKINIATKNKTVVKQRRIPTGGRAAPMPGREPSRKEISDFEKNPKSKQIMTGFKNELKKQGANLSDKNIKTLGVKGVTKQDLKNTIDFEIKHGTKAGDITTETLMKEAEHEMDLRLRAKAEGR